MYGETEKKILPCALQCRRGGKTRGGFEKPGEGYGESESKTSVTGSSLPPGELGASGGEKGKLVGTVA